MGSRKPWFVVLFFFVNLLLCSFYIDVWKNANTISRSLPIITFFESGTFRIDKYHELTPDKAHVNGHYYTDKAPLPTYFVLPFYGLVKTLGLAQPDTEGNLLGPEVLVTGSIVASSIPFALIVTLLFIYLDNKKTNISPVLLSTLPFYGSFVFIFSGTFFGHLFAGILLLGSYLFLKKRRFLLSGLLAGLTFVSEYNLAVLIFCWGLILLWREMKLKPLLLFSAGILPSIAFILIYNSIYSTSPFVFLYKYHSYGQLSENYGFRIPGLEALWGLTFSPYRGMFFYAPFLVAGIYLIFKMRPHIGIENLFKSYQLLPNLVYFVFISSYFAWWGGWTYGPRLLTGMVIIMLFEFTVKSARYEIPLFIFWPLTILGLIINIPAKGTIVYDAPTAVQNPFAELVFSRLLEADFNPNNILSLSTVTTPSAAFIVYSVCFITGFTLLNLLYKKRIQPFSQH